MHSDLSPFPAPRPPPDSDEAAFWSFARRGDLRFQRCARCACWRHPPGPVCAACQSELVEWAPAPAEARLFSWTKVHVAMHSAATDALPYIVALVEFPEAGIRMAANLIGPAEPVIGEYLILIWRTDADGNYIPAFRSGPAP